MPPSAVQAHTAAGEISPAPAICGITVEQSPLPAKGNVLGVSAQSFVTGGTSGGVSSGGECGEGEEGGGGDGGGGDGEGGGGDGESSGDGGGCAGGEGAEGGEGGDMPTTAKSTGSHCVG